MTEDVATFFFVMMTLVVSGVAGYAGFTVVHMLRRRALSRGPAELEPAELDAMRSQLAEVDGLRERVAELEERLDFAERLLTRREEEAPRLPAGTDRS